MMRSLKLVSIFSLVAGLMLSSTAYTQEKTNPKEITIGVIRVRLSSEYAVPKVDGKEWEDHYFEDDGKLLVIENIDRTKEHTILLTPIYDELAPVEFNVKPKEWRLRRIGKGVVQWQVRKKIRFKKKSEVEKEKAKEQSKKNRKAQKKRTKKADTGKKAREPKATKTSKKGEKQTKQKEKDKK